MDAKTNLPIWLKEELGDVVKYKEAAEHEHGAMKQMLCDMAHEEYEHACSVWHMMERMGLDKGMDKKAIFQNAWAALRNN